MPACTLIPTPHDLHSDFRGAPVPVTLRVDGSVGSVQFVDVKYNGLAVNGVPSDTIAFHVLPGRTTLDVVYGFSDTVRGAGTLSQVCDANRVLIAVSAEHPAVRYHISA